MTLKKLVSHKLDRQFHAIVLSKKQVLQVSVWALSRQLNAVPNGAAPTVDESIKRPGLQQVFLGVVILVVGGL